jgi:signal transduction histidine kinase
VISLSRRISIGTVALTMVVVGVAVVLVWMIARWQSLRVLDAELEDHAQRFSFMAERVVFPPMPFPGEHGQDRDPDQRKPDDAEWPPRIVLPQLDRVPRQMQAGSGWLFIQVLDADDDRELFRSPSLSEPEWSLAAALGHAPADAITAFELGDRPARGMRVAVTVEQHRPPRIPGSPAVPAASPRNVLGYLAIDATATYAELRRLAVTLGGVWLTASVLALASAWWLKRSVIGPLRRVGQDIATIDAARLDSRVHEDVPLEMAETVRLLNGLLDRLALVMEREKGTIANIAHELRSPISGLRTTLEVAVLGAGDDRILAARCLPTVVAMHGMVVNLLALARIEAGRESINVAPVDADELIATCWATIEPVAHGRDQQLARTGGTATVRTCADKAAIILRNLLDNAVTHSPCGTAISLDTACADGLLWLHLGNDIAGPLPDPQRVFETFWRGDEVRSTQRHCGLGLALAKRIAALLGAQLHIEVVERRFIAHLGLPLQN